MRRIKQLFIRGLFVPGIAFCALALPVNTTQAAEITFNFTGFVDHVNPSLQPQIGVFNSGHAQGVTGSFKVDFDSSKTGGVYNGVVKGFSINLDGTSYSAKFAPGLLNGVQIHNAGGNGIDRWSLGTSVTGGAGSPQVNGFDPREFYLELKGHNMFSNDNLQPPNLNAVFNQLPAWRLIFQNADHDSARLSGVISHLTAVPLPAAVVLFGAGLISLVGLGAGGLRNLRRPQA